MTPHSLLHKDRILTEVARDLVFRLTDTSVTDLAGAVAALKAKQLDKPRSKLTGPPLDALLARATELLPLFAELGLTEDILDTREAAHTLFFGAKFTAIVKRAAVLVRAVDAGYKPGTVHFLSGTRPVDGSEFIEIAKLPQCAFLPFHSGWADGPPAHEGDLMLGLWMRAVLPEALRSAPCASGLVDDVKAKTQHLMAAWLARNPSRGRTVVVTGPGRSYQARIAKAMLQDDGRTDFGVISYQGGSDILSATEALAGELEVEVSPLVLV